jgi:hypothetical protein
MDRFKALLEVAAEEMTMVELWLREGGVCHGR